MLKMCLISHSIEFCLFLNYRGKYRVFLGYGAFLSENFRIFWSSIPKISIKFGIALRIFRDTSLLIASLDDESQTDLRHNRNFNTYKGALYENIVADILVKAGYPLYYFRNEKSTVEMDFFIRDAESLIPVEVKAKDNATASLNKLITDTKYKDIRYGIKLCYKNIGFNGKFYTLPYFVTFLLKRWINEQIAK